LFYFAQQFKKTPFLNFVLFGSTI